MKKLLTVLLSLVLILALAPMLLHTANADTSGPCGDDMTWTFDASTGKLTFTGTGAIYFEEDNPPWYDYREEITAIELPEGMTSICYQSFALCTALTSITIPDSVETLSSCVFTGCTALKTVTLGSGLKWIGDCAFAMCSNLESINIPANAGTIGAGAFYGCKKLTSAGVAIDPENDIYEIADGVLMTKSGKCLHTFFSTDSRTVYRVPDGVDTISDYAFYKCGSLTKVILPDTVNYIGRYAFTSCSKLADINLPENITRIEPYAFKDCFSLVNIKLPSRLTVSADAFDSCIALKHVVIPYSVRYIKDNAFEGCESLSDVYYFGTQSDRDNISLYDGNDALWDATWHYQPDRSELSSFMCGDDLFWAFDEATGTLSITGAGEMWPFEYVYAQPWASVRESITSLELPEGLTNISEHAFQWCGALASVTFPESLKSIDLDAFEGCESLMQIVIPNGVTSVDICSFFGCTALQTVTLGSCVEYLGRSAFGCCENLTEINIPASLYDIGEGAFKSCKKLTGAGVAVDPDNEEYTVEDDALFQRGTYLHTYFPGEKKTSYTVPAGVTAIASEAFAECDTLDKVILPDGLQLILDYAFDQCNLLSYINIPDSVNRIDCSAFAGTALETVCLPAGLTSIDAYMFYYCTHLEKILIPISVISIGELTFGACDALTDVYYAGTLADRANITFDNGNDPLLSATWHYVGDAANKCGDALCWSYNSSSTTLTITGMGDMYDYASFEEVPWSVYQEEITSIVLPKGMTSIGDYAFSNCKHVESIDIPDTVTVIGANAFNDMNSLKNLRIPDNVMKIKSYAFSYCNELTSLTIPENVNSIYEGIVVGCRKLTDIFVDPNNAEFMDADGVLYSKDEKYLGAYPAGKAGTTYQIPSTVEMIMACAFSTCDTITDITIPANVHTIGYAAFEYCWGLKNVTILPGVTDIRPFAFYSCRALKTFVLPATVTHIGSSAFYDSNQLSDVYYSGTEAQRQSILDPNIEGYNQPLLNATWHYGISAIDGKVEWNPDDVQFRGTTPYVFANGSAHTPRFIVKNRTDGSEIAAQNYDFVYRENTNAGTGYVMITFKNGYCGTCRGQFKIYLPPTQTMRVANTAAGIKLTWASVEGAAGYVIYRRAWSSTTNGWTAFARWDNTTETTYLDGHDDAHKVYAGTRYQYGVKAYFARRTDPITGAEIGGNVNDNSGNYNLGMVGPLKTTVRITTRTLNSVTAGTKQMTVKWSGSNVFTGYQIQYATDSAFTQGKTTVKVTDPKTVQKTIKNLTSGKTYYVRVRSYHVFEGTTYYGGWSSAKNCKVK